MRRKIKRFLIILMWSICLVILFNKNVIYAEENNSSQYNVSDQVDNKLDSLYEYINTMKTDVELVNELDPVSYIQNYIENGEGDLSISKVIGSVISLLFKEVKSVLSLVLSIIVVGIICSLLKNLQSAFSSEGVSQVAFYACYALLIILLSKTFLISLNLAKDVIYQITGLMGKVLPILIIMLGAAGGFTQAATMDPIVLGATTLVPKIYTNIIIPLILVVANKYNWCKIDCVKGDKIRTIEEIHEDIYSEIKEII